MLDEQGNKTPLGSIISRDATEPYTVAPFQHTPTIFKIFEASGVLCPGTLNLEP